MIADNKVFEKSKSFSLRIIKLYNFLQKEKQEIIMSKQLLRSGTSIGANIAEAIYAVSKAEFISKLSIALKEAAETEYWLDTLFHSEYINDVQYESLASDCKEIIKMLIASTKTSKS